MDTHFSKLPNSLIEICVVVGMDQDTGLVLARSAESKKASKSSKQESPLSQTLFETHVLAALSGEVASFCCTAVEFDSEPYYSNLGILCSPAKGGNPGRRARRGSVRVKTAELPLTQEVISSLPQFCFPDGGTISKKKKPVECHSLVLTDMEGMAREFGYTSHLFYSFLHNGETVHIMPILLDYPGVSQIQSQPPALLYG
ncbi:uncharacterized protein LOC111325382 [Stylophora pistillata]|uniref:uncharacterized protein LOC111325382 n=1 Tax=Stylophora pistillata TaxID=50429 RepID=UPI000C051E87|nr:uncharacterized protein LOC111325382 [Stylophora pistillata]